MTAKAAPSALKAASVAPAAGAIFVSQYATDRRQAAGIRLMWWVKDPDRLKHETAAIDALREHEAWLSAAVPRLLKGLKFAFDFDVVVERGRVPVYARISGVLPRDAAAGYSP